MELSKGWQNFPRVKPEKQPCQPKKMLTITTLLLGFTFHLTYVHLYTVALFRKSHFSQIL